MNKQYLVLYPNKNSDTEALSAKLFNRNEEQEAIKFAHQNDGYIIIPATIQAKVIEVKETN